MTGDDWAYIAATLARYRGCIECHGAGEVEYADRAAFYDGTEMYLQVAECPRCRGYGGDYAAFQPLSWW